MPELEDFINIINKRYKPGNRKLENKININNEQNIELIQKITEEIKLNFDKKFDPIYQATLNAFYAKKYETELEKLMKKYDLKQKIVLGRDASLLGGYFVGCSRPCFDVGYRYEELKFNPETIDYALKLFDLRDDFKGLRFELLRSFDVDEPVIFCDIGLSDVQARVISKYVGFKKPLFCLGETQKVNEDNVFCLNIPAMYLESDYHPIENFKKINNIEYKRLTVNNFLYTLASDKLIKRKKLKNTFKKLEELKGEFL